MALAAKPFIITQRAAVAGELDPQPLVIVGSLPAGSLPASTTLAIGAALQGVAVADVGALTSAPSVAAPTKAEFDAAVADLVTLRAKCNALLASIRTAGLIVT